MFYHPLLSFLHGTLSAPVNITLHEVRCLHILTHICVDVTVQSLASFVFVRISKDIILVFMEPTLCSEYPVPILL